MRTFKTIILVAVCQLLAYLPLFSQSADIVEGCHPLSVNFTPAAGMSTFYWNFQNGATSIESNPAAVFTEAGTYEVELRATIDGPIVATIPIQVYPVPDLSITADPTMGCAPTQVNFNSSTSVIDPAIAVTQYSWVFGGGSTGVGISPTTSYSQPGVYSVSLNVQTDQPGCSVTEVFPDFVTLGGISGLTFFTIPTPLISCDPPLDVQIFNVIPAGLASYTWDFGNGETFDGMNPPNVIYDEAGTYNIVLTGEDSEGCTATRQRTVRVLNPLEALSFPDTVCLEALNFYDNFADADSLTWTFPPSASVHMVDNERFVVFHEPGDQEVTLSAINTTPFFCQKDTTFTVFVDQVLAEFTADPTYTCEHELDVNFSATSTTNASFIWNFNAEGFGQGPEVNYTYTQYDTTTHGMNGLVQYYTSLIAINPSGCRDTLIRADTIYVPNALFMPDLVSGCAPLTVTFADSSASFEPILEWNYDYGDGFTETLLNDDDHTHTFTEEGTYEVVVDIVNEAGCRDTSYARIIEVGAPLDIQYEYVNNDVCYGDTIEYTLINPPEELDWVHLMEPDTLFAYYNGCLTQISNPDITVHGPNVKMVYEIDCEAPFTVNFDGEYYDVESVLWDFDDGETSTLTNPVHTYDEVGDYWVKVTAVNTAFTCPSVTDSMLICIRNLEANFDLPEAICADETLVLDATSTNDANKNQCSGGYTWYFDLNGRPVQGNDTLLTHTFDTPGREYVTLIAKDVNGCRDTLRQLMNIYSMTPNFEADDEFICMPSTVNFTDLSVADTTLVAWSWDFGDATTDDSEGATSHTYTNLPGGAFIDVILTLEDAQGCMGADTIGIQIYEPVSNVITDPSPANICIGETVDFTGAQFTDGGSSLAFTWDFGEGPIQIQEISQTYNEAGSFPLNLHFVEIATGCQGDVEAVVNVQEYPIAAFTSSEDDAEAICYPAQISFMDASTSTSGISAYNWNFGNGDNAFVANPTATFDRGMFTVNLVVATSFGCTDEASQSYEVVGPSGDFSFEPAAICEGEDVTFTLTDTTDVSSYSWNFGDGNAVDNVNPVTHTFDNIAELGTFPIVLILRGAADQCVADVTQFIEIHDVRADFALNNAGDSLLCIGEYPFINSSTGADQYLWTFDDGTTSSEFEPTQSFVAGEIYDISLQVTNEDFGCVDDLSLSFEFFSPPGIAALGDTICPGDTATLQVLNVEEGWQFNWTPGAILFPSATIENPMVVVDETTEFNVQVIDSLGCLSSETVEVEVIPPFPFEPIDIVRCPGDSLNLGLPISNELFNIFWSPFSPPDIIGEEDLNLTVTIEDILDCYSDDYSVFIQSLSDTIVLPNVFSPNGDGINETFRLFSEIDFERTDLIVIKSFVVFNRWGQKVYEGSGPNAFWDGNVNGDPAPSDVYIYQVEVDILKSGRSENLQGSVTLVR